MTTQIPPRIKGSKRLMRHWRKPWTKRARRSVRFRRALSKAGYITPHFRWSEAKCKDGTPVPRRLRWRTRRHAFDLERFRHEIGDRSIRPISWYRTRRYNKAVHGARGSRHVYAEATDYERGQVERIGVDRWRRAAEKVFRHGGIGSYVGGNRHLDSRGFRARWSSYVGQ